MLTATIRPLATVLVLLATTLAQAEVAAADNTMPPKPEGDYVPVCYTNHKCVWILRSVAEGAPPPETSPGKKPAMAARPICQYGGAPQACTSALGNWSNSHQCYLQRLSPQPPLSDPRWAGHTDGSIWACVREQGFDLGRHLVTRWVWLPGEPDTVVVDPVTLAYRAIAQMQLAPPLIKSAPGPGQIGLVNMPVWLWVEKTENTWGPITRSASVPGLSVTATAQVKAVDWSLGDGNTIRCESAGTPYDKAQGINDSPDCGHRYKKTSRLLPNCTYPVTATAHWDITWQSTLGDTGQLPMTQQATTQLRIAQAIPVLIDPNAPQPAAPTKAAC